MHFLHPTERFEFEVPDEWLSAAGALNFRPQESAYAATSDQKWPTILLPINQVRAPRRDAGIAGLRKDRSINVLLAMVQRVALPPLEVHRQPHEAGSSVEVRDGFHRYFLSIALGFTWLPVSVRPFFDMNTM